MPTLRPNASPSPIPKGQANVPLRSGGLALALGLALLFAPPLHAREAPATPALANQAPASAERAIASARASLQRLGIPADRFTLRLSAPGADSTPSYHVTIAKGHIAVRGTSPVALVRGTTATLARLGRLEVSWEGRRLGSLKDLPAYDSGEVTTPFAQRAYLNTCTYGYTTPWWDWSRWEREIDAMAAHGVDTPLAMEGQEFVWRALWREFGMDEGAIGASLSAAPFLPWQRMGNMAGYRAPLSPGWIEKKHQLQIRILARMRALGMKPVLPAFAGYVPETFAKAHPEAKIYRMRAWEGFAPTYWLDPSDPLFERLAARFIALYTATYGEGQYYLADAFNEMVPPIAQDGSDASTAQYGDSIANTAATRAASLPPHVRDARLAAYGERLYQAIARPAPGATWVMQGWMFGSDKAFWTPEAIAAFLSRVPRERMLVLDIGNDRYPGIWQKSEAFDGKRWIYGYVHNYGGSNPVYGDLDFYRQDIARLKADPARGNLAGFGLFPEGLNNNSLVYDYAYDLAWGEPERSVAQWLEEHLRARYGAVSPEMLAAWNDVIAGAYTTRYWTPRWWNERAGAYLFFKRPTGEGAQYPAEPGDAGRLRKGIEQMVAALPAKAPELATYDLVDLTRHYASLRLDDLLKATLAAYQSGDLARGDASRARLVRLARLVDRLAGNQQETLGSWIADARAYGDTPQEKDRYAQDAKALVTIWGGKGHLSDYASRAWQGLYAGYYLPRWQQFLDAERAAAAAHTAFDEPAALAAIRTWETDWVADGRTWPRTRPADPLALVRTILAETQP
ncbi:alpha-N-acetylglucosaminidase C-terminal domain-containing protein [Novosphingobium profundi]|uniref:alpha-N-acetylglucosaminidase n=1 Tax=Novosphingobium profundi TaxID=1774954 RepID=UPI001BDB34FA|nr:alpha-N-acetylglucosaminidase [Novosphingobium profundi]MBT0669193.1 alpha-N-acetylglucosaminidase C-terminal domain-containing protein [Novosphingobium profundi]